MWKSLWSALAPPAIIKLGILFLLKNKRHKKTHCTASSHQGQKKDFWIYCEPGALHFLQQFLRHQKGIHFLRPQFYFSWQSITTTHTFRSTNSFYVWFCDPFFPDLFLLPEPVPFHEKISDLFHVPANKQQEKNENDNTPNYTDVSISILYFFHVSCLCFSTYCKKC